MAESKSGPTDRFDRVMRAIDKIGFPAFLVLVLLAMGWWQLDKMAELQRETLNVIRSNTTAFEKLSGEIRDLRKER